MKKLLLMMLLLVACVPSTVLAPQIKTVTDTVLVRDTSNIFLVSRNPCNIGTIGYGCVIDSTVPTLYVIVSSNVGGSFIYQMYNVTTDASVSIISNSNGIGNFRWNIGQANINTSAILRICLANIPTICIQVSPIISDYE